MGDTIHVEARVAIGGLQPRQSGHVPRKLAEMAIARGYAVRVGKLSERRPSLTGVLSTSMDGEGSFTNVGQDPNVDTGGV